MSATLVFRTHNDFYQNFRKSTVPGDVLYDQGICTAAAMNWAKKVLKRGPVDSFADIGLDEHTQPQTTIKA